MRKGLSVLLVSVLIMGLLVGCGSKEPKEPKVGSTEYIFNLSKEAYDDVKEAYEITEKFGDDIYEAWRCGIYEEDELLDEGLSHLTKKMNISESEAFDGMIAVLETQLGKKMEDTEQYRSKTGKVLGIFEDSLFSFCVEIVSKSYSENGDVEKAQRLLDDAKEKMKELSQDYSDYEHYPSLKGFYTTTSAYFDFCQNPTGSFEQVKSTVDDYRNEARSYSKDLDFVFE